MPVVLPPSKPPGPAAKHISLEYVGFHNTSSRREYTFRVRLGPEAREYTIWIPHAAFAARQALLQDGPDICFQKLQRQVAELGLDGVTDAAVTDSDLASYREAHAPPARRLAPRPVVPSASQADGRRDDPA